MDKLLTYIPEIVVILISSIAFATCLYSWMRFKEYAALGYLFPALYFTILYSLILLYNPDDITRRFWVRLGLIGLLGDIIV